LDSIMGIPTPKFYFCGSYRYFKTLRGNVLAILPLNFSFYEKENKKTLSLNS